jgi:hypothetical protein
VPLLSPYSQPRRVLSRSESWNRASSRRARTNDGVIEVSLRREPLDKRELRQAQSQTEHPLGLWLREQYVSRERQLDCAKPPMKTGTSSFTFAKVISASSRPSLGD